MPDKLTDSEIVKALECCKQEIDDNGVICGECKKCPNYDGKTGLCKEDLPTFTLDLINRLQAELRETRRDLLNEIVSLEYQLKTAKAEAYKECIEKVKKELSFGKYITPEQLDNLLKEMIGE